MIKSPWMWTQLANLAPTSKRTVDRDEIAEPQFPCRHMRKPAPHLCHRELFGVVVDTAVARPDRTGTSFPQLLVLL